jgi:hypothetical protein
MQMRDEEMGAIHVKANSSVFVGRRCSRGLSTNRRRDKLQRAQKIRCIESDRKNAKPMPRPTETSSELPQLLRQVVELSVSRLTPHAELIGKRDANMKQARDHDKEPAKELKLSAAVYRATQSLALICTLGFCAASAFAADLPAPALVPAPAFPPAVYNWTGFYVGGNLGAGWSGLSDANTNFSDTLGSTFSAGTDAQFLGGGQVGVNYQFANGIVVGAEAMFDWASNSQNAIVTATDPTGGRCGQCRAVERSLVDDRERPARLCLGPCAALRQGRWRMGGNEHSRDFHRGHAGELHQYY